MKRTKVLLLLWHPTDSIAGGFVRTKELVKKFSKDIDITVIDNFPSLFPHQGINLITYKVPGLFKFLYKIHFGLGRMVEWTYAFLALIIIGLLQLSRGGYKVIYGPTGDNPHIFFSGLILKLLFPKKKLLFDILNLEMPEGGVKSYFSNFKKNLGVVEALIRALPLWVVIKLEQLLIRNCDFVVTVSPYMKNVISKYFPKNRIDFTPSGVSAPPNLNFQTKKVVNGVYIGRNTKDKGIFDLINVWKKTIEHKKLKLFIAGSVDIQTKKAMEELIMKEGLSGNVKVKGLIEEKEKWELLLKSKYFLHLAYFEPLVPVINILEALSCGLPIIMYETKAIDDYLNLRRISAIFIVENQNLDKVVETVLYLENMSLEEMEKISSEARNFAKRFSWEEIAEKELKIIKNL